MTDEKKKPISKEVFSIEKEINKVDKERWVRISDEDGEVNISSKFESDSLSSLVDHALALKGNTNNKAKRKGVA